MTDQGYVYATAGVMIALFAFQVLTKKFDPFAPVWMFLVGYVQVYVIQAITLREWALSVRGDELVAAANLRALWSLIWFLAMYYSPAGRLIASFLPRPPTGWSMGAALGLSPLIIAWGAFCAYFVATSGWGGDASAEQMLFTSFPFLMMVGSVLLIVTGMNRESPRPIITAIGIVVAVLYSLIWMFNGKRSHSMIAVMSMVCAVYVTRLKRPSWIVLFATACAGSMVVAVAINWRNNYNYDRSVSGFVQYLGDFDANWVLKSLNVDNDDENLDPMKVQSFETVEWGGFLLMLDTVPEKSGFDHGANYIRLVSTFIPRIIWPDKPLYGRDKWASAWIAGSELKRNEEFTGPSIGLLGATQLNGGAVGTLVVLGVLGAFLRSAYEYFRTNESVPWVQAWWALSYFNAWFMVVGDDPGVWFYYNYGFTCLPILALLFVGNKFIPHTSFTPLPV